MPEQQTVEKQEGAAAPTAAAVATPATKEAQAAETQQATQTQKPTPESAKGSAEPAGTQAKPQTPQERVEFFKARQEKKVKESDLAKENAELKRRMEILERAAVPTKTEAAPQESSFLDDPDGWARRKQDAAVKAALDAVQERERAQQDETERATATKWLLSQSHVREDAQFAETVAQLMQIPKSQGGLLEVAQADPVSAAQLAYERVKQAAGIGNGASAAAASAGVRPSSTPVSGKRVFARGEGQKWINEIDPRTNRDEYLRRIEEVETAQREGRIR